MFVSVSLPSAPVVPNPDIPTNLLQEASAFAGRPPAANLRPQQYALHDLVLTGIITFTGNVFQAEVQVAGQSRA